MSLIDTLVQPTRTRYNPAYDKNERRRSVYGAWDLFQRQTNGPRSIVTPEIRSAVAPSIGTSIQIPVLDARDVTIGNVRSCVVADSENVSKLTTLTFATIVFGFTMTPQQHRNNGISYEQDFQTKLETYLLKAAAQLDTLAIDKLNAVKNVVWPTEVTNVYAQVGNALQVPKSDEDDLYNQMASIMEFMDFYDASYDVLANTFHKASVNRISSQGAGNDVNDAFQFGAFNYGFSNRIANRSGVHSTTYTLPSGTVAVLNRNDYDALAGTRLPNGKEWGIVNMPLINLDMAVYQYADCADRSALHAGTTSLTRTVVEGFEFSTDICFMSAYNSNPATRYNPVIKTEIWASDTAPI